MNRYNYYQNYPKAIGFIFFILFLALAPTSRAATFVSGTISADTTWSPASNPYIVQSSVSVNPGVILTIEPGVVVKFNATTSLSINGTLNVQGNAAQKIYFTSLKDDSVGGDTNGDGATTLPAPRDWMAIYIINSGVGNFNNVVIQYAGGGLCDICNGAGIFSTGSTNVSNSKISHNYHLGIFQQQGSLTVASTELSYQDYGLYLLSIGNSPPQITQSSIHDNFLYGIQSWVLNLDATNNWWGDASGPFHPALNPTGTGNQVSDNVNFVPWLIEDPIPQQNQPSLANLGQFKSDGATPIIESSITTEDIITFKAILSDPSNNQVKLQVELRPLGGAFTGADDGSILSSGFVTSGSGAMVAKTGLLNGQYHWRARVVNTSGLSSSWQEFGTVGNTDFEVKLVPVYTQVESVFPSQTDTRDWSVIQYGTGDYNDCKDDLLGFSSIRRCGCAIASAVMMLRYHNVLNGADHTDVNPLNINVWSNSNNGYTSDGSVIWPQISKYALGKVKFDGIVPFKDTTTLDNYLAAGNPVILYEASVGHFLLADGTLNSTHTIRDPRWYNTRYLSQAVTDSFTRNYNNDFTSLRLFSPSANQVVSTGIYISIASPAELLVTDPQGHRLGKDPINGASYNEIPSGSYYQEGISAAVDNPLPPHESKIIWIPNPSSEGPYDLQVIGTGNGTYTIDTLIYDSAGNTHTQTFASTTAANNVTSYNINFTPAEPQNIQVQEILDKIPPEAIIRFDAASKQLKADGTDNISLTTTGQQGNNYLIKDTAGNTLLLTFNMLKQSEKALDIELINLQYNSEPPIAVPRTKLKFSWTIDKKTQKIKEFHQKIEVDGQFEITAKYNNAKGETDISIAKRSEKNKEKTRQTVPGFAIMKLLTKSGSLDFGF